jgi:shikimate kinase
MKGTSGSRRDVGAPLGGMAVRAVFLVGFMGAGKTSVGRELSKHLGWRFEDLDNRIQAREGRTIPEIFGQSGETEFRRSELAALRELLEEATSGTPLIAALGGGAFAQPEIASLLEQANCVTIFLDAPVEELWRRCGADTAERPLRRDAGEFRQLYEARRPRYLQAKKRMDTTGRQIDELVREIATYIEAGDRGSGEEK